MVFILLILVRFKIVSLASLNYLSYVWNPLWLILTHTRPMAWFRRLSYYPTRAKPRRTPFSRNCPRQCPCAQLAQSLVQQRCAWPKPIFSMVQLSKCQCKSFKSITLVPEWEIAYIVVYFPLFPPCAPLALLPLTLAFPPLFSTSSLLPHLPRSLSRSPPNQT